MVPSACRRNASTMIMRVKAVIISSAAGNSESAVISARICRLSDQVSPPPVAGFMVSAGNPAGAASAHGTPPSSISSPTAIPPLERHAAPGRCSGFQAVTRCFRRR